MGDKKCVIVLCPTGHRHTIKVTPNTSLLQVLEQTCMKQGLDPVEYDLCKEDARAKPFDLTLTFRFAGLINNARLEIVHAKNRRDESKQVTVALQLPCGDRLQGLFMPTVTLWNIMQQQCGANSGQLIKQDYTMVIVYMREEIVGEHTLKTTTLKDLGITSGRALLKMLWREGLDEEANPGATRPTVSAAQGRAQPGKHDSSKQKLSRPTTEVLAQGKLEHTSSGPAAASNISSLVQPAAQEAHRPGTSAQEEAMDVDPSVDAEQREFVRKMAKFIGASWSGQEDEGPVVEAGQSSYMTSVPTVSTQGEFANFKFPDQPEKLHGGSGGTSSEVSVAPSCEREPSVYRVRKCSGDGEREHDTLPDDFFQVTVSDVKRMMQDLTSQREKLENSPLLTKAQQQSRLMATIERYGHSVLRIRFPDKFIIQANFHPLEKIQELVNFVQSVTREGFHFYLYTTPPKVELKQTGETLLHYELFPKAVVYVGSRDGYYGDGCLKEEWRARAVNLGASSSKESGINMEGMVNNTNTSAEGESKATHSSSKDSRSVGASVGGKGEKSVPKWFKLGK